MRVCHICSNYDKFYIDFMNEQKSRDIDIKVFYFRAKERGLPDVEAPYLDIRLNYSNFQRPFFRLKERSVLKDFFKFYNNEKFDIIHAHTLFSNGYIALNAKKRWGVPYIVAVRDMDVNLFFKYRISLRKLGVEILKEAEKIIFISDSYKNNVISTYAPIELREEFLNKSHVIPNGINSFFLDNKYYKKSFDAEKKLNIITVGYISKRKNQSAVLEAVEKLNEMGIKTKYTVIGKVLDKHVFGKIEKSNFVEYIPFLSREKLIYEYRNADIFVMPSLTETFGLTYVEAMSQGLPVIYSRNQGFDGQFNAGEVGYAVNSDDVEAIKERILDIIDSYLDISKRCTDNSSVFNWEDISDQYLKIYRDCTRL